MSWAEVKKINSNLDTPLNELIGTDADPASKDGSVHGKLNWLTEAVPGKYEDPWGTPGPQILAAGTMGSGYFGLTSANDLITGDALATAVGISAGTAQNSSEGWLKFAYEGRILFVAKKAIRHSISWNAINDAGVVFGESTITVAGNVYKVRLLTGGAGKAGGEWNLFMYGVASGQQPPWASYSDSELGLGSGDGRGSGSWCQEASLTNSAERVSRGYSGVTYWYTGSPSDTPTYYGWRPVLELL